MVLMMKRMLSSLNPVDLFSQAVMRDLASRIMGSVWRNTLDGPLANLEDVVEEHDLVV